MPDIYELTKPYIKVYNNGVVIEEGIINSFRDDIMQKVDSVQIIYFGFEPYMFIPQIKKNTIVNVFLIEKQQELLQNDKILKIKKSKLVTDKGIILRKKF